MDIVWSVGRLRLFGKMMSIFQYIFVLLAGKKKKGISVFICLCLFFLNGLRFMMKHYKMSFSLCPVLKIRYRTEKCMILCHFLRSIS